MQLQLPQITEVRGSRVLTTRQLTEVYKSEEWQIKQNFRNNKSRFIPGKHFITLQGNELKEFKNKVENIYLVSKMAKILYLWTEKGALLHAKSLNTDKAWEVYDYLVDFYFRRTGSLETVRQEVQVMETKPLKRTVVDIPENAEAQKLISDLKKGMVALDVLIDGCNRYIGQEKYEGFRTAIAEITMMVANNASRLSLLKPNLLKKTY